MASDIGIGIAYFIPIVLMFYAQHRTCELYFVPAINSLASFMRGQKSKWRQRWSEDAVLGATLCAFGCNGPEMFSNLISLYTGNDAGIGVVVGSEVYNILIIISATIFAAPQMPLPLSRAPFVRDACFYVLSIGLVYWALLDGQVSMFESYMLLAAEAAYVFAVYFTTEVAWQLGKCKPAQKAADVLVTQPKDVDLDLEQQADVVPVIVEETVTADTPSTEAPSTETPLAEIPLAEIPLAEISSAEIPLAETPSDKPMSIMESSMKFRASMNGQSVDLAKLLGEDLALYEVVIFSDTEVDLEFAHSLVVCEFESLEERNAFLELVKMRKVQPWIHDYDPSVLDAFRHLWHAWTGPGLDLMRKFVGVCNFIIDVPLKLTLSFADVKYRRRQGRWFPCFMGSMIWLAIWSFAMLELASLISHHIPVLTEAYLGITLCAVGTSFPNTVASYIMSKNGRSTAAVSNALGSNVQNVFIAMALPWAIYTTHHAGTNLIQNVAGINEGIIWMFGTLALLLICVALPPFFSLTKLTGVLLVITYLAYVGVVSAELLGGVSLVKG